MRLPWEFFGRSGATFPGDSLPPTNKDTVFEVRPIYRVTQKQLMEWANKKANSTRDRESFASGGDEGLRRKRKSCSAGARQSLH